MPSRKPTATKALAGTLRKDRVNAREPRPARGPLQPRRGTPSAVRTQWRYLVGLLVHMPGVATVVDAAELELASFALAEYHRAVAVVLDHGHTYEAKTEAGAVMHRARPEVAIAADAWRRAHAALQTFGLSPSSRAKVEGAEVLPPGGPPLAAYRPRPSGASRFFPDEDPLETLARRRLERQDRLRATEAGA
jgi:P27 family predicted phage terminase small subunit